jgi:Zn-dependent protease with chaperone function
VWTVFRAGVAVAMLVGFYLFVVAFFIAILVCGFWFGIDVEPDGVGYRPFLLIGTLVAAGAVLAAAKPAFVPRREPSPRGVRLSTQRAARLWALVQADAATAGAPAPDELRLSAQAQVTIVEEARWLGLAGGYRTLYIGVPLLRAYTVSQLRAAVTHELGHFSHRESRIAAVAHRGRSVIVSTAASARTLLIALPYLAYALVYVRVERATGRRMELAADRAAVAVAGTEATARALTLAAEVAAAWDRFQLDVFVTAERLDVRPHDVFDAFERFRQESPAAAPAAAGQTWWDAHPPLSRRLAALHDAPAGTATPDDSPAVSLLDLPAEPLRTLADGAFHFSPWCRPVPWDELRPHLAGTSARRARETAHGHGDGAHVP